ncbi:Putative AC9 transposase, partial [Linum grandiflorum]
YLAEDVHPRTEDFDLLGWWKFSGAKYPILQDIARDLLAVPVTSVASESAFSSGGRLLDPHQSRLLPATVEAMMVLRSWIQDDSRVTDAELKAMDGVFSAMAMDDATVEESTSNSFHCLAIIGIIANQFF